ncbi:terminase [Streptomyces sp. NPDC008141]|uniref:terminase n=1 Tax=Streptomyces sp. NPDC008141 TaxID=3364815 RepID=UPI0036E0CD3E
MPPRALSSAGQEAVELAASAGLELDPWQRFVLDQGLREKDDGTWAAWECAVNVPRQNGKGAIIEARELAGLFLLDEELILHSAHELKTALEAMRRIEELIAGSDELRRQVKVVRRKGGEECIELKSGARLRFIARSRASGRGMTGDCNIMDEAMILGEDAMAALMFTMAAVPNPQIWYLGSSGIGSLSVQLGRLRRRALEGLESGDPDPSLAYFEWSINPHADECQPGCKEHDDVDDPASLLKANPAIGYRLTLEHTVNERLTVGAESFARERLGVGTYPADTADTWRIIGEDAWQALVNGRAEMGNPVAFALDTTPERSHTAICAAGRATENGVELEAAQVEVIDHRPGTGWAPERLAQLVLKWQPVAVVIDEGSPAGSLIPAVRKALEEAGLDEQEIDDLLLHPKARQVAAACAQFYDAAIEQTITHLGPGPLSTALAGADKRPIGDGWAWKRRGAGVDISPLMGATFAMWGYAERKDAEPEGAPNLWI